MGLEWKKVMNIAAMSLLLATTTAIADGVDFSKPGTLGTASGRYVFGQISRMARDQYMLDTQTGRLWQITEVTRNGEPQFLSLKPVVYDEPGTDAYQLFPPKDHAPTKVGK